MSFQSVSRPGNDELWGMLHWLGILIFQVDPHPEDEIEAVESILAVLNGIAPEVPPREPSHGPWEGTRGELVRGIYSRVVVLVTERATVNDLDGMRWRLRLIAAGARERWAA